MAKAALQFQIPLGATAAFQMLGAAMTHNDLTLTAQDGWTLTGKESYGIFKMGFPSTVTATVAETGPNAVTISLQGQNFGWGLNTVHVKGMLNSIEHSMKTACSRLPPAHVMEALDDDPNLPPRVGYPRLG